jgi:endonuclease/exonuclease/phosphatase family metal-dependent hydrolase
MNKNRFKKFVRLSILILASSLLVFCSSADVFLHSTNNSFNLVNENNQFSLVTYNIKAIYEKEENQINKVMEFINDERFDFVLFQELFNESTRDYIIENTDTNIYRSIISRVDYNSFPEFFFQDAGLFMMGRYPMADLSGVEFDDDICVSNGVIHMILDKEISRSNDFLANKSILGSLFNINESTQLFLFTTHVQALGTMEHKNFQIDQIREFINKAVISVIGSDVIKSPENLAVMLAGDFNSNAYSLDRFENLIKRLGGPRDLHMEHNGEKQEFTFKFRHGRPARRFDYIFSYDMIDSHKLKRITTKSVNAFDLKDEVNISISDHSALRATLKIE